MKVKTQNKVLRGALGIAVIALVVIGGGIALAYSGGAVQTLIENANTVNIGNGVSGGFAIGATETSPTYVSSDATRMNDTYMYGDFEVKGTTYLTGASTFSGATTLSGAISATGAFTATADTRIKSLVQTGITTYTATGTVSAANFCDSNLLKIDSATSGPTLTLFTSTTAFADCLTADGDTKSVMIYNNSAYATILAAGAGGTLKFNRASTSVDVGISGLLTVSRVSSTAYKAGLVLFTD